MAFNDSLSDMLARIKNAHKARKSITSCYKSNLNMNVLSVLKDEGYIDGFSVENLDGNKKSLNIELKYYAGQPVIEKIVRVSKPGLRIYKNVKNLPNYMNGLGIVIISTSKGVMTDRKARSSGIGGEILCYVS